jgi:hypothetical protein
VLVPVLLVVVPVVELSEVLTPGDDEEVVGVVIEELDIDIVELAVEAELVEAWL